MKIQLVIVWNSSVVFKELSFGAKALSLLLFYPRICYKSYFVIMKCYNFYPNQFAIWVGKKSSLWAKENIGIMIVAIGVEFDWISHGGWGRKKKNFSLKNRSSSETENGQRATVFRKESWVTFKISSDKFVMRVWNEERGEKVTEQKSKMLIFFF